MFNVRVMYVQSHDSVKCVMCVECAAVHSAHWQLTDRGFHPAGNFLLLYALNMYSSPATVATSLSGYRPHRRMLLLRL